MSAPRMHQAPQLMMMMRMMMMVVVEQQQLKELR